MLYTLHLCVKVFSGPFFLRKTSFRKPAHNFGALVYLESRKPPEGTFLDVNIVTWDLGKFFNFEGLFGSLYTTDASSHSGGHAKFIVLVWNQGTWKRKVEIELFQG